MADYAFIPAYTDGAVSVIDVSNPAVPTFKEVVYGHGAPNWLNGASGVYVVGNYVYVASYLDSALTIIYSLEPHFSSVKGSIHGGGAQPWLAGASDVRVVGNYAYVTAQGDDGLTIIDISNPAAPVFRGSIRGAGAPNWLDGAWGLDVVGNLAYVCAYGDDALTIIDVSNPLNPILRGSIQGAGAPPFGFYLGGARRVHVVGNYAYVAAYFDNALTVIDVSNPAAPAFAGGIRGAGGPNWLARASGVHVVGNYAYVTAYTDDALTIINISNPLAPTFVGSIQGAGAPNWLNGARSVRVTGNYAYVAAYLDWALTIIDISNPAVPTFKGSTSPDGASFFLRGASSVFTILSPVVSTSLVTNITQISATFNGLLVNDGGTPCACGFEWGLTGAFGNTTPTQVKSTGESFSQTITGLVPNTEYCMRTFATNASGLEYGETRRFTTPIPVVVTLPATEITASAATIRGIVADDSGFAGEVRFQWGGTSQYGMETPWQQGGFHTGDTFFVRLINLREGTVYHFKAQFRNNLLANGGDMMFVTTTPETQMVFLTQDVAELLGSIS